MAEKEEAVPEEKELPAGHIAINATAKVDESEDRVAGEFVFDVGETVADAVEKFGEELVYDLFTRALTIKGQAAIRRELENGTHPDDIQNVLGNWDPTEIRTSKKDPKTSIVSTFKNLSDEDREAVLASLKQQLQ